MKAGKLIAYIGAGVLLLFGILMVIGATDKTQGQMAWLPVGLVLIGVSLAIIFVAARRPKEQPSENVTLKVDLPGNVNMDTLKCRSCGGALGPEDIQMVAGAPVVTCPYCHTTYQLTEEPKW
jgi:Na+/melibiose symporter-like transporter